MSILIIGLGSMGRRRIRCLQALDYNDIIGFDLREDRRAEAKEKYGIKTIDTMVTDDVSNAFICTPPNLHKHYSKILGKKPHFIEAGTEVLEFGTPSATMLFNPIVQRIKHELPQIGSFVNLTYHCGQYLPDWHPYEKVSDFYVAQTGALEMVIFELMWMTHLFGIPVKAASAKRTVTEIEGLKGPDSMVAMLAWEDAIGTVMIDVVSRTPIRQLVLNGTEKQFRYDLNEGVSEQMYVDEVKAYMGGDYPNTVAHNNKVVEMVQ